MNNELIKECVAVVWNRRPEVLLKKQGIMVLGAFKVHLTPEIKATITSSSINTDLVMNSGEMTHNCCITCYDKQTIQRPPEAVV